MSGQHPNPRYDPSRVHWDGDGCQPPHERPTAERLAHALPKIADLTARLAAAEQRAKAAEAERDDWKLSSDFEHADVERLQEQLADRDATIRTLSPILHAARAWITALEVSEDDGEDDACFEAAEALCAAVAACSLPPDPAIEGANQ